MKNMNFTPNFYVVNANVDAAAGQTAENGDSIDVGQADCVTAIVELGAVADTGTGTVHLEQRDTSSGTWTDVPQASLSFAHTDAHDSSNDTFVLELAKPTMRYVRVVITRATANTVVVGGHYIVGGLRYTQGDFDNYPDDVNVKLTVGGEDANTHTNPRAA